MRYFRRVLIAALIVVPLAASYATAGEGGKESLGAKTIAPPSPVWVIGSYDADGQPNMMTASWVGVCCSDPPCVTISLRKATYTYGNIMENGAYTVNIPSRDLAPVAAYTGRASGRDTDKFADTGLTPVKSELVNAPLVAEFPLTLECQVIKTIELGLHTMFIAQIRDVKADSSILGDKGAPDPAKLNTFIYSVGGYGFYEVGDHLGDVGKLSRRYGSGK
ncbi:MAG: flavin reductase family protein [Candidatus Latescibacteria bacterium]|nr:flavin reductase family protein [bacterium]MBD3425183.1 flavin reductase family protein [Candidatus Latescibacterota bacterium]